MFLREGQCPSNALKTETISQEVSNCGNIVLISKSFSELPSEKTDLRNTSNSLSGLERLYVQLTFWKGIGFKNPGIAALRKMF